MAGFDNTKDIVHRYSIDINQLTIKKENIQAAMGYKRNSAPDYIIKEIDMIFSEFGSITDICGGFKIIVKNKISLHENGFYVDDIFFNTGSIIASNLYGSDYIAFLLVTAGNVISEKIKALNLSHNHIGAYTCDIVGSEIAESACDFVQSMVEETAKQSGLSTTHRYSPGYCGWNMREQHILFSLLPEDFCHIALTESALMIPVKSVSGIIGIGKKAVKRNYGCSLCTIASCYKRRKI